MSSTPAFDGNQFQPHSSHWGVFSARMQGGIVETRACQQDPDPNPLIENFRHALDHPVRIERPMVRKGWLDHGPGPDARRGRDEYVPLSWPEAIALLGTELARVRDQHGPEAVFGGSYGWSSAGRFHHAQSQVHRFLNTTLGGYVRSVNSYSEGAAAVIIPHVLGDYVDLTKHNVTWEQIEAHTDVVVAFGGMALKNSRVAGGGVSRHLERGAMARSAQRGCRYVLVSPLQADLPAEAQAEWISCIPGTDTALMLALVHTLVVESLHDQAFLDRYTTGWAEFERYLLGHADGQAKDAQWAAAITGVHADTIRTLARTMAGRRTLIVVSHSLQRAEHGEQPVWMGAVLAAALGQLGLPGGGYAYSLGAIAYYGRRANAVPIPTLPQGKNGVSDFIPVARIADMLLHPGAPYRYNGETRNYPNIKLVYWAGGNPFHHHQDLNRLRRAFAQLDTLVVHDSVWTASAKHADFVLPATMTLERMDIGASSHDPFLVPMKPIAAPFGEARDDYAIFADLAEHLGLRAQFTAGQDVSQWLSQLYAPTQARLRELGVEAPDFDAFWRGAGFDLPQAEDDGGDLRAFRENPERFPLKTPSGRVEIFSKTIAAFNEPDCLGHPAWFAPTEVPNAKAPLHLVANQPATRLHSQLDFGAHSSAAKRHEREVARMHPSDAAARSIADGDVIRIFNQRGACLAAAHVTSEIRAGVVQLPTGAWYDPDEPSADSPMCVHGNANVLTRDQGSSSLAQGCTGQLTAVQVEKWHGGLPPIRAYTPPKVHRSTNGPNAAKEAQ